MARTDLDEAPRRADKRILLALLVPAAVVVGFLLWKGATVAGGETVILKPQAYDPRDPFRGDYVVMRYDVSFVELSEVEGPDGGFAEGGTAYVVVRRADPAWRAVRIASERPDPRPDEACLRGEVVSSAGGRVSLEYGLESYFVPEGRGREVEEALREERVLAEVKTDDACRAVLTRLLVDGEPWP